MASSRPPPRLVGGRYALEVRIGRGGMGEVWQARHAALGSIVAVKLLRPALAAQGVMRARFLSEARLLASLSSRRVVRVFDYGVDDETPFLAMELIDGETLASRLRRLRKLSPHAALRLLAQAARGLESAHAAGIVHCDFKPDNVLVAIGEDGELEAKLIDFGLAARVSTANPLRVGEEVLGTPAYMAPEQLDRGASITASSDVWSFGVVAYECLVGALPFDPYARDPWRIPRRAKLVGAGFARWFARVCNTDPGKRPANAGVAAAELAVALGAPVAPRRTRRAPIAWCIAAAAGLAFAFQLYHPGGMAQRETPHFADRARLAIRTPEPPPTIETSEARNDPPIERRIIVVRTAAATAEADAIKAFKRNPY